ncbi:calphotin, putative [Bacillus cereus G9241]|nr:calphotin, putative [Bacillus cereus G9241]
MAANGTSIISKAVFPLKRLPIYTAKVAVNNAPIGSPVLIIRPASVIEMDPAPIAPATIAEKITRPFAPSIKAIPAPMAGAISDFATTPIVISNGISTILPVFSISKPIPRDTKIPCAIPADALNTRDIIYSFICFTFSYKLVANCFHIIT